MSPVTLHVKVKVASEHVGEAAVNCPVAAPAWRKMDINVPHGSPTINPLRMHVQPDICSCAVGHPTPETLPVILAELLPEWPYYAAFKLLSCTTR